MANFAVTPSQDINQYSGTNLSGSTITFSTYTRFNYNIRISVSTEINVGIAASGTLTVFLNGTSIKTMNYRNGSGFLGTNTLTCAITEFGDAMYYLLNGILLAGNNNLTFSVSSGNTTSCNYSVSVVFSL